MSVSLYFPGAVISSDLMLGYNTRINIDHIYYNTEHKMP